MITVYCTMCECKLKRKKSVVEKNKTGKFFCSRECRSADDAKKFQENKVESKCVHCGKITLLSPAKAKKRVFCSNKCIGEHKTKEAKVQVQCDNCNLIFTRKKGQLKNNNLCSVQCRSKWNSNTKNLQINRECPICHNNYKVHNAYVDRNKTCSRKCHVEYLKVQAQTPEVKKQLRQNGITTMMNIKSSGTKPEIMTRKWLNDNKIEFKEQHLMHDKFIVDFFIPKLNIVLEVFGDYWHGNPNTNKILSDWQIKQQRKDKTRKAYLEACGYVFISIWENDIYQDIHSLLEPLIK